MAKRGRKPKERKGYFYETEEQAIVQYINEEDENVKNRIFNTILYPALTKMIESIIRRYKLFVPDEEFEQNFSDTISYLLTKINHFRPIIVGYDEYTGKTEGIDFIPMTESDFREKVRNAEDDDPNFISVDFVDAYGDLYDTKLFKKCEHKYKAYSYCGTVCKNYLMYKCSQYTKKRQRNTPYDDVFEEISNSQMYSTEGERNIESVISLLNKTAIEIEKMVNEPEKNNLSDAEVAVGHALVNLLKNWEDVLPYDGSNKLQKSSVLYFLREETMMTTKEIRDNMKAYKQLYYVLKKIENE